MPAIGEVPDVRAVNMPTTEQVDVEFDERLQDICGTWDGIAGLELFGGHGQKTMMGTEDAQFAWLAFVKVLSGYLHLARGDLGCAIETYSGNSIGAIEKFGIVKMREEFALPPAIDAF